MRAVDGEAFPLLPVDPDLLAAWDGARNAATYAATFETLRHWGLRDGTGSWEAYCAARAEWLDAMAREHAAFLAVRDAGSAPSLRVVEPLPYPVSADE
jgi:hypothetical protein